MTVILFLVVNAFQFVPVHYGAVVSVFEATPLFRHAGNTRKAEAFNQAVWESGFVDIYTIKATIEVNDELRSITADVNCVPKIETQRADIKGGPYVWDFSRSINPPEIFIHITENYRVVFDADFSCGSISKRAGELGFPFTDNSYRAVDIQHITDPVVSCRRAIYEGVIEFRALQIFPIEVMSMRQERVSEVLTREEYGPADRAIARRRERSEPPNNELQFSHRNTFFWRSDKMCWGANIEGIRGCKTLGQKICPSAP